MDLTERGEGEWGGQNHIFPHERDWENTFLRKLSNDLKICSFTLLPPFTYIYGKCNILTMKSHLCPLILSGDYGIQKT